MLGVIVHELKLRPQQQGIWWQRSGLRGKQHHGLPLHIHFSAGDKNTN